MNPILILDYAGIAVFAATGALAASRKQLDIIGFLFFAAFTGVGAARCAISSSMCPSSGWSIQTIS